jgi:MFS family permease
VAGYFIEWYGYAAIYYLMAAIQIGAIVATWFLPRTKPSLGQRRSVVADVSAGFKYILGHRTIFVVLFFMVSSILLAMPYMMLMPVFAKDILHVGVEGQGTLMSVSGVGALAASLTLASLPSRRRGVILLTSNILLGFALLVFAFSVSWPLSLGMMVLVGLGRTSNNTAGAALLQAHVEPEFLGRVMSIMMMNMGLSSLGTFFAGVLAESISVQWAIGGLAIILGVISLVGFVPRLVRKLD